MDAENARLAIEIQEISTEMMELQKSLKENASFDNVVADRMKKIEEMEVGLWFVEEKLILFSGKVKRDERNFFKFRRNSREIEGENGRVEKQEEISSFLLFSFKIFKTYSSKM